MMGRKRTSLRIGALVTVLMGVTVGAWAEGGSGGHGGGAHEAGGHEAGAHGAAGAKPVPGRMTLPVSPISLIEGSKDAWSVSNTEAGCFLMSPTRKNSSRVAIGRHPELGLGLLAVNIALSVPGPSQREKIALQTTDGQLAKDGRMVGAALLFMPLSEAELDQALRTLSAGGRLWLIIRDAWLSHAGLDIAPAIEAFHKQCDSKPNEPVLAAATAAAQDGNKVAPPGSKSASAP